MTNINAKNNVFKNLPEHFNQNALYGINIAQNSQIPSVKISDTKNPKKKGKILKIITATMGSSVIAAGIVAIVLSRGLNSTTYNKINKLLEGINESIDKSVLSKKSSNLMDKTTLILRKGLSKILSSLKAAANFTAVKDNAFDNLMRKNKFTTRIADKITDTFKKIATNAVDLNYRKAFIQTNEEFSPEIINFLKKVKATPGIDLSKKIKIKEIEKPLAEWISDLENHHNGLIENFKLGFSKNARNTRAALREKSLEGLDKKVGNTLWHENGGVLNIKKNNKKFATYITETLSQEGKTELRNDIISRRKKVTNNITHNYNISQTTIREIKDKIDVTDKNSLGILRQISEKMDAYKTLGGSQENSLRNNIVKEVGELFEKLQHTLEGSDRYTPKTYEQIKKQANFIIKDILESSQKGELEETLTIIKGLQNAGIMDDKTAKTLYKKAGQLTKQLNNATQMEANELYEKFAEFKVGSAPTDVLSLLFPAGVAVASIASADKKDEKVSKTLTTGIPIVGSIATMLLGTVKMISGPKNMIIGFATGAILNTIGNSLDKLYKNYQKEKSFTKLAIEAYKNNPIFKQEAKIATDK